MTRSVRSPRVQIAAVGRLRAPFDVAGSEFEERLARMLPFRVDEVAADEVAAVDAFFIEFLKASVYQLGLLEWPAGIRLEFDMGEVLIMIVHAGGDLDAALAAFDASPDPEAAVHMASMRHDVHIKNGRVFLHDPFLDNYPEAADKIGLFLMRDSVDARIVAAPALLDDPDFDEVLELGMGMTKH